MELIKIIKSNGTNNGYCWNCKTYFKKNDYVITFDKCKINKITKIKICVYCYLKQIADKVGWTKLNNMLLKSSEEKI